MADEDDFARITLRLPRDLHERLTKAAAKRRSTNAEIIMRLEASFMRDQVSGSLENELLGEALKGTPPEVTAKLTGVFHRVQHAAELLEEALRMNKQARTGTAPRGPSPYELGQRAFQPDGKRRPKNPFGPGTEDEDLWEQGYDDESRKGTMQEDD